MKPFYRPLLLLSAALASSFLIVQALQSDKSQPSMQRSILRVLTEGQRREALDHRWQHTWDSIAAKRAIAGKLIDRHLALAEAVAAYCEVHAHQLAQNRAGAIETRPLSKDQAFKEILGWVQNELSDRPGMARKVVDRLQKEWRSLPEQR